jgi:hyperosmotically inducible protein
MSGKGFLKFLPGLMFTIALASPALAEDASQSMKEAGHSAANAVSHAWQGTKTAVKDTDITTKVKIALHNEKLTKGHDIHVTTHDGVVTLTGRAPTEVAHRAVKLARETTGVVSVNNDIRPGRSVSSSR